jgi:transposase
MLKARTLVGLDVHAEKIVAAILDFESGELRFAGLSGRADEAVSLCRSLPGPVRTTYEAGPTGYGLARALEGAGIGCLVAAPGKVPRGASERVKTDRRDAEHLVRLLLAGKLHAVRVPGTEEEALRDLVRAREDIRGDLMRARHRLSKLLLRHEVRFEARAWTGAHQAWLGTVELGHESAQATLADYRGAVDALTHRRSELERLIEAAVPDSAWAAEVARLRCLRGVDTLSAVGLCCEIGDFRRFARAGQLMSYVGLVPSEHSSGEQRRLGSITKSGSRHARRLLVEAGWHYRARPNLGVGLSRRQAGQPRSAVAISWTAQQRLHRLWERMRSRRKRPAVIAVAAARELAGFCWAITDVRTDG